MAKETKRDFYSRVIAEQRKWISDCGGDLAGYIDRYGTTDNPKHGDGGELIYKADVTYLAQLEHRFSFLRNRNQTSHT